MPTYAATKYMTVTLDDSGGTARTITGALLEGVDFAQNSEVEDVTAIGDGWRQFLPVDLQSVDLLTLSGLWDSAANSGNDTVSELSTDPNGSNTKRTFTVTWRSGVSSAIEVLVQKYTVQAKVGSLHRFTAELQPTGELTRTGY